MTQETTKPCIEITEEDVQCLLDNCCDNCKDLLLKLGIVKKD
jgi:hypothetical protein